MRKLNVFSPVKIPSSSLCVFSICHLSQLLNQQFIFRSLIFLPSSLNKQDTNESLGFKIRILPAPQYLHIFRYTLKLQLDKLYSTFSSRWTWLDFPEVKWLSRISWPTEESGVHAHTGWVSSHEGGGAAELVLTPHPLLGY